MAAAGKPQEALAPFAKALTAPSPPGDPDVSRAFALGWHVAERAQPPAGKTGEIGMGALEDDQRERILARQIQADVALLGPPIAKAQLKPPDLDPLPAQQELHVELLCTLTAADYRLGKAYGLGLALAEACAKTSAKAAFEPARVAKLLGWLDELSSALPPHAAGSVSRSLELWRDHPAHGAGTARVLRRQGELWRSLLSGEKRGTEMLDADSYLVAARGVAAKTRQLVLSALRHFPILTSIVIVLLVLGIVLLAVHSDVSTLAGATSLLAALGISWKALGGAIGKLVAAVEEPLWGAELDVVIAQAVTMLPEMPDPWNRLKNLKGQAP